MTNQYADIILTGAAIYCGAKLSQDYDFIAISGNRIMKLGKAGEEDSLKGPNTKMIYMDKEQFILPGLHDNHVHIIQAGMLDKYVNLGAASSQEEAAQLTAEFAKTIPGETWVIGFGWTRMSWNEKSLPVKQSLDAVIPDRPVLLLDSELHGAWANSKAFELTGVDRNTKDPEFGEIAKDENGEPSGYLYETALSLIAKHAFDFSPKIAEDLIMRYMRRANEFGITSTGDMTPYLGLDLSYVDTYCSLNREGKLTLRVNAARNLFEDMGTFLKLKEKAEQDGTGMYRVPYMKQFLDGVITNYTALMLADYSDKQGERGGSLLDLHQLNQAVLAAHRNNISVRLHACGDGAVRAALDAFEHAEAESGKTALRHQIEHVEVIAKEDIPRFHKFGVIASVQPEHIVSGIDTYANNCYPQLLGPERERYTWAFRSLQDEGAVIACGSDAPVVEGNPFLGMHCGLTRLHPDGTPEGGWNPKEKMTIEELIEGYTYGAAYAEHREDELGTLEAGKLADITILDTNLLRASADEIKETKAIMTIVDGKIVYEK